MSASRCLPPGWRAYSKDSLSEVAAVLQDVARARIGAGSSADGAGGEAAARPEAGGEVGLAHRGRVAQQQRGGEEVAPPPRRRRGPRPRAVHPASGRGGPSERGREGRDRPRRGRARRRAPRRPRARGQRAQDVEADDVARAFPDAVERRLAVEPRQGGPRRSPCRRGTPSPRRCVGARLRPVLGDAPADAGEARPPARPRVEGGATRSRAPPRASTSSAMSARTVRISGWSIRRRPKALRCAA